jgi:Rrf2 family transcriptional regulator, nitric oxide-sensitive transcriptional repressor
MIDLHCVVFDFLLVQTNLRFVCQLLESVMISQTAQYALRAVVCLAHASQVSMTTEQLAEMTRVPSMYLSKVMQSLVRADIVSSKPGKTGGFSLKISPDELSLLAIIEAIDVPSQGESYPLDMQAYGSVLRPLHQKLSQMDALVRKACSETYIKDIIS